MVCAHSLFVRYFVSLFAWLTGYPYLPWSPQRSSSIENPTAQHHRKGFFVTRLVSPHSSHRHPRRCTCWKKKFHYLSNEMSELLYHRVSLMPKGVFLKRDWNQNRLQEWKSQSILVKALALPQREELEEIQCELLTSTFRFSAMFRSFIPKANKPGMFRPITQPAERDRIVMEG